MSGACTRSNEHNSETALSLPLAAIKAQYEHAPIHSLTNIDISHNGGTSYWTYISIVDSIALQYLVSIGPTGSVRQVLETKRSAFEFDPVYSSIISNVQERVIAEMEAENLGSSRGFGACHTIWNRQKDILYNEHGLDWKTPAELNPYTAYD